MINHIKKLTVLLIICFVSFGSHMARAQCDISATAQPAIDNWINNSNNQITSTGINFTSDIEDFLNDDFDTAQTEMTDRLTEFHTNIRNWMGNWWETDYLPAQQEMTKQYNTAVVDQTPNIGRFLDAEAQISAMQEIQKKEFEARRGFTPSEQVCQADSAGQIEGKTVRISRAITRGLAYDAYERMINKAGATSEFGSGKDLQEQWDVYTTRFCDPDVNAGFAGCDTGAPSPLPGEDIQIGDLLWGHKLTIDMSVEDNRYMVEQALKNVIDPFVSQPIPTTVLSITAGRDAILQRRSMLARKQAIYNVLGQLFALRAGGSDDLQEVVDIRTEAGIDPADIAIRPSYREIAEAMNQERHRRLDWSLRVIDDPEALQRNQVDLRASHLKQMNDIYKRMEELTLLTAVELAFDLDKTRMLDNASRFAPRN